MILRDDLSLIYRVFVKNVYRRMSQLCENAILLEMIADILQFPLILSFNTFIKFFLSRQFNFPHNGKF